MPFAALAIPVLGEIRNGPVDPISINKSEFIFSIRFENARVGLLAFEELVDEGANIWKLTIRERTVAMVSNLRQTHRIGDIPWTSDTITDEFSPALLNLLALHKTIPSEGPSFAMAPGPPATGCCPSSSP